MKHIKTHKIPNTAILFIILAPITVIFYATYIFNPIHAGNIYLYFLQIIADIIAIFVVGSLWITIILDLIQPEHNRRDLTYDPAYPTKHLLSVDVLIPTANEPLELLRKTVVAARNLDYPHETYILDDGNSAEVREFAKRNDLRYIARPHTMKHHAKSGNINYALNLIKGDFFAVFDADHVPKKHFITELLPFFENKKVALVQTPQHYTNTHKFIASGTAQAQEIFYKYVQPAKNSYNSAFCVGTNMIYRREAITDIGGIAKRDHSEDIWTTILLHEKGWESVFYNKILAEGVAPETIGSFFRQQNRWARGGFTLFFHKNPLFIRNLSIDQRLQYFFSNIHYFSGFAVLIYLSLPLIYLYFGEHPMNLNFGRQWLMHYLPYAVIIYLLPLYLLGNIKLSTISTSMSSFAAYIQAFLSTVVKNQYRWVSTETKRRKQTPIFFDIWPHVLLISLSIGALLVGWYNPSDITTTTVTSIWVVFNMYMLFVFIKKGISDTL